MLETKLGKVIFSVSAAFIGLSQTTWLTAVFFGLLFVWVILLGRYGGR